MPENRRLKSAWWPLLSSTKAKSGESLIGWYDDWRGLGRKMSERPTPARIERPLPLPEPMARLAPEPIKPAEIVRLPEPPAPLTPPTPPAPKDQAAAAGPPLPIAAPPVPPRTDDEVGRVIAFRRRDDLPPPPEVAFPALPQEDELPPAEPGTILEPAAAKEAVVEPAPIPDEMAAPAPAEAAPRLTFFQRLARGLNRTAEGLNRGLAQIFTMRKIDEASLEELEDLLITSDLGVGMAARLTGVLRETRIDKETSDADVRNLLADEVVRVLKPAEVPFKVDPTLKPHVVLIVGVNGTGKTTTIGKLAHQLKASGKSVMLAAGDTFRAAAIDQLKIWGERVGAKVIARDVGADAAGLAFDAVEAARAEGVDVLLIDTAGRLQNKAELMAELEKVTRVLKKIDPSAPHSVLQVLDATTGQNALAQVEVFQRVAKVTGLIMTKLDGTARGGILVPLTEKFGLPIHAIGVGEGVEDLQAFDAAAFARAIAGLDDAA